MSKPFIVLATFKPEKWSARIIGQALTDITDSYGLVPHDDPAHGPLPLKGRNWVSIALHAEVRRRTFRTQMAEGWHYDGDTTPGAKPKCCLVLWASNHPTEIRFRGSLEHPDAEAQVIWTPRPYELVLFNNLDCVHRRPLDCPRIRWVFRQRVEVPSHPIISLGGAHD